MSSTRVSVWARSAEGPDANAMARGTRLVMTSTGARSAAAGINHLLLRSPLRHAQLLKAATNAKNGTSARAPTTCCRTTICH